MRLIQYSGVIDDLPNMVDRLESLKKIHEESAELMINMNQFTNVQNSIKG